MKIASIVGARPQFIKLGPLSKVLRSRHTELIIHTGQHYDEAMSEVLFTDLRIPVPDYNLEIGSGNHGEQTGRMLGQLEKVLIKEHPDLIIVFGDTNTTLAGALAGVKLHMPVLHIEAGLRSHNRSMPEEINRVAVDHIADYLFAPTPAAAKNLQREGLEDRTQMTGDIMVDALRNNSEIARLESNILQRLDLTEKGYYLLTLHRPYTVDHGDTLRKLFRELAQLDGPVVFPVHPRTLKSMETQGVETDSSCIVCKPLGYLDFLCLMLHSRKILTDSGGVQKEAYLLGKPCITLRSETEWMETVDEGWNLLLNSDAADIAPKVMAFSPQNRGRDIFGSEVAEKMLDTIDGQFANSERV